MNRVAKSVLAPGEKPTMTFTGLLGYCCAEIGADATSAAAASAMDVEVAVRFIG
jgi:hypothetical protein